MPVKLQVDRHSVNAKRMTKTSKLSADRKKSYKEVVIFSIMAVLHYDPDSHELQRIDKLYDS